MAFPKDCLHIKIVDIEAKIPTKRFSTSVEYELSALESIMIPARGKGKIRTGLIITPPTGMFVRIENKAEFAYRNHVSVVSYNLNPSMHEELVVEMFNFGDAAVLLKRGYKFACITIIPRYAFNLPFVCELPDCVRVTPMDDVTGEDIGFTQNADDHEASGPTTE